MPLLVVLLAFPVTAWAVLPAVILVPLAAIAADVAVIASLSLSIYVIVRTYRYLRMGAGGGRRY